MPVAFVTGDDITCEEAEDVLGKIITVTTKTAISTNSAKCKQNEQLFNELKDAVIKTVRNSQDWSLYKQNPPYTLEIEFAEKEKANIAELLPCIKRVSANRIRFDSENYEELYKLLQFFAATLIEL